MESIFKGGNFNWALFIGQLAIEKILKAMWVKENEGNIPPKTHNLKRLAENSNCNLTDGQELLLLEVTDFNLEARYPDFKFDFYKKCTREFTAEYIQKIKELHQCIVKQI